MKSTNPPNFSNDIHQCIDAEFSLEAWPEIFYRERGAQSKIFSKELNYHIIQTKERLNMKLYGIRDIILLQGKSSIKSG